jgi:hypothetical protein
MASLHRDWKELLRLFVAYRVRFMVVGAHALAAHGRPRLTGDLDLLVEPTQVNARRVLRALDAFGFGGLGLSVDDFARPGRVVTLGRVPARVDLMTRISGVSFRRAWAGRLEGRLGAVDLCFLGKRELMVNKRASGRPKDLLDLCLLDELAEAAVDGGQPREPKARRRRRRVG